MKKLFLLAITTAILFVTSCSSKIEFNYSDTILGNFGEDYEFIFELIWADLYTETIDASDFKLAFKVNNEDTLFGLERLSTKETSDPIKVKLKNNEAKAISTMTLNGGEYNNQTVDLALAFEEIVEFIEDKDDYSFFEQYTYDLWTGKVRTSSSAPYLQETQKTPNAVITQEKIDAVLKEVSKLIEISGNK